ncbi:MAG: DUF2807 domain-containing protein [Muribaculaceae bacterium]|nr:DUF2807 domain-containing protein [Muribaculaceae bacterium]
MKLRNILTAALAMIAACGAAETQQYSLKLEDFSNLQVTDGINVVCHTGSDSAGIITYECTPEIADKLIFESGRNRLKLQVAIDEGATPAGLPTVHVHSASLAKVENSGDSTVTVLLDGPLTNFSAVVVGNGSIIVKGIYASRVGGRISTGNGHLVLSGRAAAATLTNVGTGSIEAGALEAKEVRCMVAGTGSVDCCATERLRILGMGSGKVYYTGSPNKVSNNSIGVKAIDMNATQAEE